MGASIQVWNASGYVVHWCHFIHYFVRKLLQPDPKKRLTAKQTLAHQWCAKAVQQSDKGLGAEHVFHLKRFQYIRRLRRGVRCILAVLRLIEALQAKKK